MQRNSVTHSKEQLNDEMQKDVGDSLFSELNHITLSLDSKEKEILSNIATVKTYKAKSYLLKNQQFTNCFYLLLNGSLQFKTERTQSQMPFVSERAEEGDLLGLLEYFCGQKHQKDIIVEHTSKVAVINHLAYNKLLELEPQLWQKIQVIGQSLMRRQRLSLNLDKLFGPFGPMLPFVIKDVENQLKFLKLSRGQTLLSQNQHTKFAYVLITGKLQVINEISHNGQSMDHEVLPGQIIGENALLTNQPHSNEVYAIRDSEVVGLPGSCIELLLHRNSKAIQNITRILGKRDRNTTDIDGSSNLPQRAQNSISLIHGSPNCNADSFANQLKLELKKFGSTKIISSTIVDQDLDIDQISQTDKTHAASLRVEEWLLTQEHQNQFLIYQSDAKYTQWSARCISHTDQILVVAHSEDPPDLSALKEILSGKRQRWSLVLRHKHNADRPRDTAKWFYPCVPENVYHVRDNNNSDMARLARIITGNAIGLVLGGGGARGFAHIGVIKAIEELNIPIDLVGGTSMGAPIAGMLAQGESALTLKKRAKLAYHKIIDVTLPLVSIISGRRISNTIRRQTENWNIEDYWLPFFCVSTNLTTGTCVIHDRGSAWLAIRSSVSIPGILPPVPVDGDLLVDGGVLNNLPVDVMRHKNRHGKIIAVDVAPPSGPKAREDFGYELSGWKILMQRFLPWLKKSRVPNISTTIMQSMVAGSALKRQQLLEQNLADLYLNIHVKGVGMMQFDALEKAESIGYEGAYPRLVSFAKTIYKEQLS